MDEISFKDIKCIKFTRSHIFKGAKFILKKKHHPSVSDASSARRTHHDWIYRKSGNRIKGMMHSLTATLRKMRKREFNQDCMIDSKVDF